MVAGWWLAAQLLLWAVAPPPAALPAWQGVALDGRSVAVQQLRAVCRTPILTGLPFGHVPTKVTMPLGRPVRMVVDGRNALIGW